MTPTHRKKIYTAHCAQWDGTNTDEVIKLVEPEAEVTPYGGSLMIRWARPQEQRWHIQMFHESMWVRIGENGAVKLMTDEEFKLKYEELT